MLYLRSQSFLKLFHHVITYVHIEGKRDVGVGYLHVCDKSSLCVTGFASESICNTFFKTYINHRSMKPGRYSSDAKRNTILEF